MLLLLLLHLLVFHLLTARDVPPRKDTQYVIKQTDTCPDVGYYFKREPSLNTVEPGPCYLCFCQEDNTAVCWKRDNRRCNVESFHYHGVGKRDSRIRRSPGFADLFFRDAARDLFNKNEKAECKPFESSFSDDCPPADWCIGCTVCDCDAHGRWNCHVLSFCPEKKNKKKSKRKGPIRKIVSKKTLSKSKTALSTNKNIPKRTTTNNEKNTKTTDKAKTKITDNAKTKTTSLIKRDRQQQQLQLQQQQRTSNNKIPIQKRIVKKSMPIRSNMTPGFQNFRPSIRYKRITPKNPEHAKEMIIKKNVATHKPIDINASKINLEMEIAQKVMKKVMANLRKSINGEMVNISKMANNNAAMKKPGYKKNIRNLKMSGNKPKAKPKPAKKVNKRQIKKPQRKPPPKRSHRKPIKNPVKKSTKKPTKTPTKTPPPKIYHRYKRNLIMAGDIKTPMTTAQVNPVDFTNTTVNFSVTPATSNLLSPGIDNYSLSFVGKSTIPENDYYKYFLGAEDPNINTLTSGTGSTKVNVTETVFSLIGTEVTPAIYVEKSVTYGDETNKRTTLTEINPEANDLKFSKWLNLKILKDTKLKSSLEINKGLVKLISPPNGTISLDDYRNKVRARDIEMRPWKKLNSKKRNLVKFLTLPKCKAIRTYKANSSNIQTTPTIQKKDDLYSIINKLLREYNKSNTTNSPRKNRKFSVIRYFKRILNKLFKRKKTPSRFRKHHIIQTLCENFGPCKISIKDQVLLKNKLADLDTETTKILRIVKIIKGLLKLVDVPQIADSSKPEYLHTDIQKLNNILKGSYAKDGLPLTEAQLTQIEYIKRNTQDFIQSVSKFASLLNQIIHVLTKHDMNVSRNSIRILRSSKMSKNNTKDNPFQDLRSLLVRYNLIQNSFMNQMYEQLNNFENKMSEKPKVSEVKDLNNTVAIENFSRNIIQNLRKLKRLAQTLNYNGRTKREVARDDDAIEYLLMLMEYLLKQNHPLDVAPVNDGIDLLIEAIKNAPDIKSSKKKVLQYTPTLFSDSTTTSSSSINTEGIISDSDDDSPSESEKSSSEDITKNKLEETEDTLKHKIEENKELADMMVEEDKDGEDKYQYDRRVDRIDDITEMSFYNRVEDNVVLDPENTFETTTIPTFEIEVSERIDKEEVIDSINKPNAVEYNKLDKQIGIDHKKFEVFTGDMDEDVVIPSTITFAVSELPSSLTTEINTQAKKSKTKMRHLNLESFDSESIDKKSKLEWIEENFGKETEKEFIDAEENNTTLAITITPRTTPAKSTEKADVSVLTREVDETDKKKKSKLNAEDVMFRKQMDLLNSLDYGTEKIELEESESKDPNVEDRYSSDAFPSYFV